MRYFLINSQQRHRNLIAGFIQPSDTGQIILDGKSISGPGADRGVVFQKGALFDWRTVKQNIEFSLEIRGDTGKQRAHVSERLISLVGLA